MYQESTIFPQVKVAWTLSRFAFVSWDPDPGYNDGKYLVQASIDSKDNCFVQNTVFNNTETCIMFDKINCGKKAFFKVSFLDETSNIIYKESAWIAEIIGKGICLLFCFESFVVVCF